MKRKWSIWKLTRWGAVDLGPFDLAQQDPRIREVVYWGPEENKVRHRLAKLWELIFHGYDCSNKHELISNMW